MLLIVLQWCLCFLIFWSFGQLIQVAFGFAFNTLAEKLLAGIILVTLDQVFWSFFLPTASVGFLLIFLISIILLVAFYKSLFNDLKKIKPIIKNPLLYVTFFVAAWIAAQKPTLFDHNSYYAPTLQWFSEFGATKGIANLHPFLAQSSFWHILQSTFSGYNSSLFLDDLNGLMLLIGILFFLENKTTSFFKYYFIMLPIGLMFLDSASTDLPIYVLVSVILHASFEKTFGLLHATLIVFLVAIKVTLFPLLAIIFLHQKQINFARWMVISTAIFILWGIKNYLVSGFMLYPLHFKIFPPEWLMSQEVSQVIINESISAGYAEQQINVIGLSIVEKLTLWWQLGGVNGIFNKSMVMMFFIMPFSKCFKTLWYKKIYVVFLSFFMFLLLTSPQYRFFLMIWMFFGVIIVDEIIQVLKLKILIPIVITFFFGLSVCFVDYYALSIRQPLNSKQLFIPFSETHHPQPFETVVTPNLSYQSPTNQANFFVVGYLPLPSSNKEMLDYFETYYGIRVKQIDSTDFKKGFKHHKQKVNY